MQPCYQRVLFVIFSLMLAACASTESHSYKLYPGPERAAAELAVLDLSRVDRVTIDGLRINRWDYDRVELLPGAHRIVSVKGFGFSVMVEPAMHGSFERALDVTLAAGKQYKVIADRTHGHGYRVYFWVEEVASGEVIAGERKP
jgi:hypothetical protein